MLSQNRRSALSNTINAGGGLAQSLGRSPTAAVPVPGAHAAVDIPHMSASHSLSRAESGVGSALFGASPAWDQTPSSYHDSFYGASPMMRHTPMPYLVRVSHPRPTPRPHCQSSEQQLGLPIPREDEEEDEEGPTHSSASASLPPPRPGPIPRPDLDGSAPSAQPHAAAAPAMPSQAATVEGDTAAKAHGGVGGLTEPLLTPFTPERQAARPASSKGVMPHTPLSRSLVFGAVNAIAAIPTLIAYAAIVFKDPIYAPYLDLLCKFFFVSSAIHQAVFCLLSSLPYAVGQVQDVGLIFLSAMASSIAVLCDEAGRDAATALGTALLTMTLSTFMVGLGTLAIAKYRLAGLVQYLPLPVVGGYLGFVGYFCVASGIGLGCGVDIDTIDSWAGLASWSALAKLLPTLGSCAAMMLVLEHVSHPLALPAVMASINLAFHACLLALGVSLEEAQAARWTMPATKGNQKFWDLWGLYNIHGFSFEGIYLSAMFRQIAKFFGLFLVVCFGSCMDIVAIQQDTPQKIDFDRELTAVAVANMATGAVGCGYTGSYIFSQTVFTMRAGVFSRWNGIVVVLSELLLFALPFSVVQYMPNFFFGALLLWFGIEISRDWLFLSIRKVTLTEYLLLWLSFAAIMQFGLEVGIGLGIVFAVLYFAFAYAQSQVVGLGLVHARSSVVRTLEQQAALDLFDSRVVTARLRGFVFFGSANSIATKLHKAAQGLVEGDTSADPERVLSNRSLEARREAMRAIAHSRRSIGQGYEALKLAEAREALSRAPRYMILDFTQATGLDATGARTFSTLCRDLMDLSITPVVTGLQQGSASSSMRQLLLAHGIPLVHKRWPPVLPQAVEGGLLAEAAEGVEGAVELEGDWECCEFSTLQEGLRWCEDNFLEVAVECGLCPSPTARVTLEALLRSHLPNVPFTATADPTPMAQKLMQYLRKERLRPGESLWLRGEEARDCYVIEKGSVRLTTFYHDDGTPAGEGSMQRLAQHVAAEVEQGEGEESSLPITSTHEYGPGCVIGVLDLYLHRPRASTAVAISSNGASLLRLPSTQLNAMAVEAPLALNLLQAVLMRAICRDLAVSMGPAVEQQV